MKRAGFTLLEVMISTIILSVGLVVLLTSFMNCQKIMLRASTGELAQYVLILGETAHPLPEPEQVTREPWDDDLLTIDEVDAETLLKDLNIDEPSGERLESLRKFTFERTVDRIDDDDARRSGYLYTVRSIVRWGGKRKSDREQLEVITLWRKKK